MENQKTVLAQRQVFSSSKHGVTVALLWLLSAVLVGAVVFAAFSGYDIWPFYVIVIPSTGLLLWILLQTGYVIDSEYLYYFQGPFRGKILISSVRQVTRDEGWIKGSLLKPALDHRGMMIAYGTFDTIFIAPDDYKLFLATLLERNPSIEIKGF